MDECRKQFEETYADHNQGGLDLFARDSAGNYCWSYVQERWAGWQAAWNRRSEAEQKPAAWSREDIVRLAREAGFNADEYLMTPVTVQILTSFAALAATAYGEQVKEVCAKYIIEEFELSEEYADTIRSSMPLPPIK